MDHRGATRTRTDQGKSGRVILPPLFAPFPPWRESSLLVSNERPVPPSTTQRTAVYHPPSPIRSPSPVLHITNARKIFGRTIALDGGALDVGPREWVGLLGPNGAAKTTLIGAIAGRVALDAGTLTLFGTDIPKRGAAA